MLTCKKCDSELHEDQKVCIVCGTRTIRGDGYDWQHLGWQWRRPLKIGAAAIAFIYLIILIVNVLRVLPPEVVAENWLGDLLEHRLKVSRQYVTPELNTQFDNEPDKLRAIADDYYTVVTGEMAKPQIGKPVPKGKNGVKVQILFVFPDGNKRPINLELVKQGRRWLINSVQ